MKVLLKRFYLNGNTIGFHPQTQKLEMHNRSIVPCESTAEEVSFEWSYHRILCSESIVRTTLEDSISCSGSDKVKISRF